MASRAVVSERAFAALFDLRKDVLVLLGINDVDSGSQDPDGSAPPTLAVTTAIALACC